TAIQAFTPSGRGVLTLNGPKDRLAQFDAEGLECRNADQGAGQSCSNYVVKFADCDSVSLAQTYNNDWTTQNWTVEPVTGTRHVRLRNGSGRYLAVQSTGENAKVIIVNSG